MKIKELKSKKLYKEYNIEIPFEDIDNEINEKIKSLIPTITIPGFRKGKAPVNIVKKKYEDSVVNEVIQKVINFKISDLIKEKKYNLFRQPRVDLKNFEKNKPVQVEVKIDLQPEIKLLDFKELKLNKYEMNLSKKEIEEQYKNFLNSQKNFKKITKNRSIIISDKVTINFETDEKNVPEYMRVQKNIPIEVESENEILPGLNKDLISKKLKEGDRYNFTSDLSKLLKNDSLKKVEYKIEVISIEERIKFKISKEYLDKNGFKNEDDLKDFLKNNSIQQFNQGINQIEKKQLMDILNKKYVFDIPEGVLDDDFNEILHRLEHAKKEDTLDEDDKALTEDKLKERYKKISQRRVKLGVLLQHIAKEENIEILEDELSKGILQYASRYPGQEKQIMEYLKKNPSSVESIKGPMLEEKIINTITSRATVTNKKINEDQYKKLEDETFDIKRDKI